VELNPVRAGIVESPDEYRWTSYRVYVNGEKDGIVDMNPEYEELSRDVEKRRSIYRDYVESGEVDKRDEGRYFKEGAYGSREFI